MVDSARLIEITQAEWEEAVDAAATAPGQTVGWFARVEYENAQRFYRLNGPAYEVKVSDFFASNQEDGSLVNLLLL
jgi:hypothetical protein